MAIKQFKRHTTSVIKPTRPKVTSIVLTWNSADYIETCIDSLLDSGYKTDLLIIDNNSSDNTRELITCKYPSLKLINTGENLGYAGGNNIGILEAITNNADYIFILNPDARIAKNCITSMVGRIESDTELAGVSPKIYYEGSNDIWFAGSVIKWHSGVTTQPGGRDEGQFDSVQYTERLNGCAMLIKTSVIKEFGLMDNNFFLYYEESDWTVTFTEANYRLGFEPSAMVWHAVSSSTGGHSSTLYHYYMTRNKLYFVHKHHPLMIPVVFTFMIFDSCLQILIVIKRSNLRRAFLISRAISKGYFDYFTRRLGKQSIPS